MYSLQNFVPLADAQSDRVYRIAARLSTSQLAWQKITPDERGPMNVCLWMEAPEPMRRQQQFTQFIG